MNYNINELYIAQPKPFTYSNNKVLKLWDVMTWPLAKSIQAISLIFLFLINLFKSKETKSLSTKLHPPGPKNHFMLGVLPEFLPNPLQFLNSLWHTYGRKRNICRFNLLNKTIYLVTDPQFCHIISMDSETFIRGSSFEKNRQVLGDSLLTAEGDIWRKKRHKILQHLNLKNIKEHDYEIIKEVCAQIAKRWSNWVINQEKEIDILEEMSRSTIEVISRSLLGVDLSTELQDGRRALDVIFNHVFETILSPLPTWLLNKLPTKANKRYKHAIMVAKQELLKSIDQQQLLGNNNYLTQRFAEEGGMTEEMFNDILNVFLAGYETTAQLLIWTFYELSRRPEIYQKLCTEIANVVKGDVPTLDELAHLPFLTKIIQEILRIYPPAPIFVRDVTKEIKLGEFTLKKGDIIFVGISQIGQDANRWNNPGEFNPDRFGEEEIVLKNTQYDLIPFGSGKHRCVGQHLSLVEAKLILATLAPKFNFELIEIVNPIMRGTLHPEKKIKIKISRRSNAFKRMIPEVGTQTKAACPYKSQLVEIEL
jgi:cytochrome P450